MLNEIIRQRKEKLEILYAKRKELENEIKEREDELRYFENKLGPVNKLASLQVTD